MQHTTSNFQSHHNQIFHQKSHYSLVLMSFNRRNTNFEVDYTGHYEGYDERLSGFREQSNCQVICNMVGRLFDGCLVLLLGKKYPHDCELQSEALF